MDLRKGDVRGDCECGVERGPFEAGDEQDEAAAASATACMLIDERYGIDADVRRAIKELRRRSRRAESAEEAGE